MSVEFPRSGEDRSTTAAGRGIVADALRSVSPASADAAEQDRSWRGNYLGHFRQLIEAGRSDARDAVQIATDGLASVTQRFQWSTDDGEGPIGEFAQTPSAANTAVPQTETVSGQGDPVRVLGVPVSGDVLTGSALDRQLDAWVEAGNIEPSVATSVRTVAANPEWLQLPGKTLIALGAAAEAGPTTTLLSWGARVAALDLPREELWDGLLELAAASAGTLLMPTRSGSGNIAARAGLDLLTDLPESLAWINQLAGPLVLGNYVYADGGTNVRAAAAGDALLTAARETHPELGSACLATPTDVFVVPADAVAAANSNWDNRGTLALTVGRGLTLVSGGRLLTRNYPPGSGSQVHDALVPQQGPNYALGKRIHRWRGTVDRAAGRVTSLNIAPPTRTRSVTKNPALAAAYAGAHRFGVRVFEPATTRALMAALLVHDLYADRPGFSHPWEQEAYQSAHGGLWRTAYSPRSALGIAAVLGYPSSRG